MNKIVTFTIEDATITFNDATKLQYNSNNCYKMQRPYIFVAGYRYENYVLLHELQGFITNEVHEPNNMNELEQGLLKKENPYYLDVYGMIFDSFEFKNHVLHGNSIDASPLVFHKSFYENFHLFGTNESEWKEIDFNIKEFPNTRWEYFANGMIHKIKQ
jgi:hypothetical protein